MPQAFPRVCARIGALVAVFALIPATSATGNQATTAPVLGRFLPAMASWQDDPVSGFDSPVIIRGVPTRWATDSSAVSFGTAFYTNVQITSGGETVASGRVTYFRPDGTIAGGPFAMEKSKLDEGVYLLATTGDTGAPPVSGWMLGRWTVRLEVLDASGSPLLIKDLPVDVRDPQTAAMPELLELRTAKPVYRNNGLKKWVRIRVLAAISDPDHVISFASVNDDTRPRIPRRLWGYCNKNGRFDHVYFDAVRRGDVLTFTYDTAGCNVEGRHDLSIDADGYAGHRNFRIREDAAGKYRVKHF